MQVDTNWYWNQQPQQHVIIVPTRRLLHPRLEVNTRTDFHAISKSVLCTRTQAEKCKSRNPICLNDSDYD